MFEQFFAQKLISKEHEKKPYVLIADHFCKKDGTDIKSKNLSVVAQSLSKNKTGKPENSEVIDEIIESSKSLPSH